MNGSKNFKTHILKKIISNCKMNIELVDNFIYEIKTRRYGLNIAINTLKATYEQAVILEILVRGLRDILFERENKI